MAKKLTVSEMKKRLDVLLKVVRYYGSPDGGEHNYCATCPKPILYKISDLQCGHFIKRGNQRLKYEGENMMPQCRRCNHFLDGAQDKAAVYILDRYGECTLREFVKKDKQWLNGELSPLKREDYVHYYNEWLERNRRVEYELDAKLIPSSWELTD